MQKNKNVIYYTVLGGDVIQCRLGNTGPIPSDFIERGLRVGSILNAEEKKMVKKAAKKNASEAAEPKKRCLKTAAAGAVSAAGKTIRRRVTFEIEAKPGQTVCVAGSFNDWEPSKVLSEKAPGVFSGTMMLAPGVYEYKFVVDGDWRLDERNPNFAANDFGTLNSVLVVE